MNYDAIILELLSRIQTLEEKVEALSQQLDPESAAPAAQEEKRITTAGIRAYIQQLKQAAADSGEPSLTVRANEISRALKLSGKYPMICNAMRQCMADGDRVLYETASGYSSTLEILYAVRGDAL